MFRFLKAQGDTTLDFKHLGIRVKAFNLHLSIIKALPFFQPYSLVLGFVKNGKMPLIPKLEKAPEFNVGVLGLWRRWWWCWLLNYRSWFVGSGSKKRILSVGVTDYAKEQEKCFYFCNHNSTFVEGRSFFRGFISPLS